MIVFKSAPRAVAGLALALVAVLTPLGDPHTKDQPLAAAAAATGGRLLLPRFAGVHVFDLATGTEQALHRTPEAVLGAAWSPDGARVAYVQFGKEPGERYGGADIYVFDGSQAALALARAGRDDALNNPVWTADGGGLIYDVISGATGGSSVELAAADGSERRTLVSEAHGPALSPDGSLLAFVQVNDYDSLVVRPLGGGEPRQLLAPSIFIALRSPRFSSDGRRLAFMAVGGASNSRLPPAHPLGTLLLGPDSASAHGLPWDPWVMNIDGGGLHQVARLSADDPSLTWAPDGSALVVLGGDGLWLAPTDGGGEPSLISHGGYGTLDWRP